MEETPDPWGLRGKVAIVTGAARGIGLAAARLLRARGARLVVSDASEAVEALVADDVVVLRGDAAEESTARATVARAHDRFGRLDILVNNAGRALDASLTETSVDDWDRLLANNARSQFLHAREAVGLMADGGGGSIVATASISGVVAFERQPAYAASKAVTAQLVRSIAIDYGRHGIRANAVLPGVVETDMLLDLVEGDKRTALRGLAERHPIGRVGRPEEIAEVIAFLASPASSFMTGALVVADGGWTAR